MNIEFSDDFAGWPPEQTIFPVGQAELQVLPGDHPLYLAEREAIAANWEKEIAANPALFDGRMVLHRKVSLTPEGFRSEGHVIPYSAFLWWRKQASRAGGIHVFGYPVLESSDGALIAIRMGEHTANPGLVYFACGSMEPEDIVDGHCDVDGNMRREVLEETGLDLRQAETAEGYNVCRYRRAITLFRLFRFELTADEMISRIERHIEVAEEKEIAAAVAIRSADRAAHPYHVAMLPVLDWYFGGGSGS
ncbi:DNA mismatch repair protein MutT [Rhizobium sp. LC145]|jgi:8-oxo-dGTP pyrophosphatase MutT (NUDIX family)|uniref:DNA mismatch repair protein MutT n=1 Tax=Rhizobium sp. LC145 TaxID=1120688 RepID=UPI00062A07CB|nr:DNA mismatch repair protein MutT [Rhizobium sp. LC145]KKX34072.1 DNA mismatch repair protein MutT [Rhizobium sp. LC145]TKT66956.1 NUDIX hydrolase [Rhizobiaceae bacterium LC148]